MARYIDADKAVELIKNYGKGAISDGQVTLDPVDDIVLLAKGIDLLRTADVVEVKHGKWNIEESQEHFNVVCQNCDKDFYVYKKGQYRIQNSNYCPNCGAKMDGGEKDDNL